MPGISYYRELAVNSALLLFLRWTIECSIVILFYLISTNYEESEAVAIAANATISSTRSIAFITVYVFITHMYLSRYV